MEIKQKQNLAMGIAVMVIVTAGAYMWSNGQKSKEAVIGLEDFAKPGVLSEEKPAEALMEEGMDESLKTPKPTAEGLAPSKDGSSKTRTSVRKRPEGEPTAPMTDEAAETAIKEQIKEAIQMQISTDYTDFFNEHQLSAKQKEEVTTLMMESKQHQQELIMMLVDEHSNVADVLAKQDKLRDAQEEKLEASLGANLKDSLDKYTKTLPEKNMGKQVDAILDGITMDAATKDQLRKVFIEEEKADYLQGKSLNLIQSQHSLNYRPEHLELLKGIVSGSQSGDTTALKTNLANEEARIERVLEKIKDPKVRTEVKSRLEQGLSIQRNVINFIEKGEES